MLSPFEEAGKPTGCSNARVRALVYPGPLHSSSEYSEKLIGNDAKIPQKARSSAVEHLLDTQVVGGSIPLAPTNLPARFIEAASWAVLLV